MTARVGAVVIGRNMYEAAEHWGDKNPFGAPVFVVTHRPEEEPDTGEFSVRRRLRARRSTARTEAAGDKDVSIGGGGDVIRQGLEAGIVDELAHHRRAGHPRGRQAPVRGFTKSLDLENCGRTSIPVGDLHGVRGEAIGQLGERAPHSLPPG